MGGGGQERGGGARGGGDRRLRTSLPSAHPCRSLGARSSLPASVAHAALSTQQVASVVPANVCTQNIASHIFSATCSSTAARRSWHLTLCPCSIQPQQRAASSTTTCALSPVMAPSCGTQRLQASLAAAAATPASVASMPCAWQRILGVSTWLRRTSSAALSLPLKGISTSWTTCLYGTGRPLNMKQWPCQPCAQRPATY